MAEEDTVPTARMHWTRLVLGRGHPIIIIIVLTLVGLGICWFSLQKISSITQTPTRYVMVVEVNTEGCDDVQFELDGDIGSFGPSLLQVGFADDNSAPLLGAGCWLKSFVLRSNLALQPASFRDEPELVRAAGGDLKAHAEAANGRLGPVPWDWDNTERIRATVVDGALRALDQPDSTANGPVFSMRVEEDEEDFSPIDLRRPGIHYEVSFEKEWQPLYVGVSFSVPENVRTYFDIFGSSLDREVTEEDEKKARSAAVGEPAAVEEEARPESDEPAISYDALDISVSFRTDEVSVVRGMMSDSGNAESINGTISFGIENNDAESRRENGNVRYSAVLGIGIALIVEAFVILLAIAMRALAARLGIAGAARSAEGRG